MKRFKTLLLVMVMALAVLTWANRTPAIASGEVDDTAVEETIDQEEDEMMQEDGTYEENAQDQEEWNSHEEPEAETQEEPRDKE